MVHKRFLIWRINFLVTASRGSGPPHLGDILIDKGNLQLLLKMEKQLGVPS